MVVQSPTGCKKYVFCQGAAKYRDCRTIAMGHDASRLRIDLFDFSKSAAAGFPQAAVHSLAPPYEWTGSSFWACFWIFWIFIEAECAAQTTFSKETIASSRASGAASTENKEVLRNSS